jgi:hypothetical protein
MLPRLLTGTAALLLLCQLARAGDIDVKPGTGTITAAAANAKPGDTLLLAPGEYTDTVELGEGVTLKGAGAEKTSITSPDYAIISCTGPKVTIIGVELRPGEKTFSGVNSTQPVRVERCRFKGIKEGVAMMGAPLSDVVFCDFIDCGIGVRAIGKACPTVWGCKFSGGQTGVFGMDGSPYIRNNLFVSQKSAIRLSSDEAAIIRNNVFWKCGDSAIDANAKTGIFSPSIRNNIFDTCAVTIVCPVKLEPYISNSVIHAVPDPAFHYQDSTPIKADETIAADPALELTDQGELKAKAEVCKGKGIRLNNEPPGTKGTIGLDGLLHPGVAAEAEAKVPPVRFAGPIYIANSVAEEYMALTVVGMGMQRPNRQSTGQKNGVHFDTLETTKGGKPVTVEFDIDRFFSEARLKP